MPPHAIGLLAGTTDRVQGYGNDERSTPTLKCWVGALLAALLVTTVGGLAGCGNSIAYSSSVLSAYLNDFRSANVALNVSDAKAIELGAEICSNLSSGEDAGTVVDNFTTQLEGSEDSMDANEDSLRIANTATSDLCPKYDAAMGEL